MFFIAASVELCSVCDWTVLGAHQWLVLTSLCCTASGLSPILCVSPAPPPHCPQQAGWRRKKLGRDPARKAVPSWPGISHNVMLSIKEKGWLVFQSSSESGWALFCSRGMMSDCFCITWVFLFPSLLKLSSSFILTCGFSHFCSSFAFPVPQGAGWVLSCWLGQPTADMQGSGYTQGNWKA